MALVCLGRAARVFRIAPLALLSVACGGGGSGSSGPSEAPFIRSFQVSRPNSVVFGAVLDVFDAQADVFGGTCRVVIDGAGTLEGPINQLLPGANPNDPEGDVVCAVRLRQAPPRGLTITGRFSVIDRGGHESNALDFVVTFELPHNAAASEERVEPEAVDGSLQPRAR
jgi:hypothetical protein